MYSYSFEKLGAWQSARSLTKNIYIITNAFPNDEKFGLVSQMRRAAISISSNIAEGSSRKTAKDQTRFYNIAYSSGLELLSQLILSLDLQFIDETTYNNLREDIEKVTRQINGLVKSISKTY
ncbi:MAG: four helix bundle protein [Bacteroidales bacterium]|nr:four helix bundle protein [Bacteroidales bacterium]MDD4673447.1 four helix bundle protein [Bacteroidales bacterium]